MQLNRLAAVPALLFAVQFSNAADWTMGGASPARNPVSLEKNAPTDWQIEERVRKGSRITDVIKTPARNVRWSARVGGYAFGGPTVAGGLVWVGTNNSVPLDPEITGDMGVLACFRESDGKFLYQLTSTRVGYLTDDWPINGLSCTPVVEGDKLWFINNRREIICLDFGRLRRGEGKPTVLWKYDLRKEQGVVPYSPMLHTHNTLGSPLIHKDLLFVATGNGAGRESGLNVAAPDAPSLVCLRKDTGKLVWKQNSPDTDVGFQGHCVSPLLVEVDGKFQIVHPQGDGWIVSLAAESGAPLWTFDTNHKNAGLPRDKKNPRHSLAATPVFAGGRIYVAAGRTLESCGGPGRLFCIDPSKAGDVSPELDDGKGGGKLNPNSALIWDFTSAGEEQVDIFHETLASVAVHEELVIAPDISGFVHCLDARTGKRHWTHEISPSPITDPLIVDGKIFVANEEGHIEILALSKELRVIARHSLDYSIHAPPVFANGTLFIQTCGVLHAIEVKR